MGILEEKVRAQFKHWVEEDELDGIIDSELQKARDEVAKKVQAILRQKLEAKVEEYFKDWEKSESAKQVAQEVGDRIIQGLKDFYYEEDFDESSEKTRRKVYISDRSSYNNPQAKVYKQVEEVLAQNISYVISSWGSSQQAKDMSNKVIADLIPQAAGAAIERLAVSFLQGRMHPQNQQDINSRY